MPPRDVDFPKGLRLELNNISFIAELILEKRGTYFCRIYFIYFHFIRYNIIHGKIVYACDPVFHKAICSAYFSYFGFLPNFKGFNRMFTSEFDCCFEE